MRGNITAMKALLAVAIVVVLAACSSTQTSPPTSNGEAGANLPPLPPVAESVGNAQVPAGQHVFRFDTFGDERFWTDTAHLNEVIQTSVSPKVAFSVGLKIDADALPRDVIAAIRAGKIDLNNPAVTVALIKLNAVVGVIGKVDDDNNLRSVGISCALCHSTVNNSIAPGIGSRLDGWPNRDLNPGAIIALSPAIPPGPMGKDVYNSWGPGRYDPRFNIDHFVGTLVTGPVLIPPAYGLAGVDLETYTGDGPIPYWNDYVAVTQMHALGNFSDPRLGPAYTFTSRVELVAQKLPLLRSYEVSLAKPAPPPVTDPAAVARGKALFMGAATCSSCHTPPTFTDANARLHPPDAAGTDTEYAMRSATKMYRTTPLRGLALHPPYFHNGSAATLLDVVNHYNTKFGLGLSPQQKSDLVAYLRTL
jgi:mono/diheme cytochrome c family protein